MTVVMLVVSTLLNARNVIVMKTVVALMIFVVRMAEVVMIHVSKTPL